MADVDPNLSEQIFLQLAAARYLSVATTRRDGREILTPVWAVALGGRLYCYTAIDTGKVKRVRRTGQARLSSCDLRGGKRGEWHACPASIGSDADLSQRVSTAPRQKYGWQMRLADFLAWCGRRLRQRAVLEFELLAP